MSSFVKIGERRLEYRWAEPSAEMASKSRPVLVFLHEGLGSVALWKQFPDRVADQTGCRALIYSRYGYGRSDELAAPRLPDYMHREALDVLPALLDRFGIEDPVLVGHSDGASIALIHAGSDMRRLRGVVALAPHVFVEEISIRSIEQAKTAFESTSLGQKLARYHDHPESMFRGWNDIWLHPDFRDWNIEDCLPAIRAPLLLIQGEDDQYGSVAQIEAIERQAGTAARTCILRDCAHSPHVDQPEATVAEVSAFVGQVCE